MLEILESEGASISGDDDFFSVARTIPFVAFIDNQWLAPFAYQKEVVTP